MWRRLGFLIRRDERRTVAVAFAFLFVLIASHMALESARDGLFMARIPGGRLPLVYIGIALLSFLATKARVLVALPSRRLELTVWTVFAAVGTIVIGVLLRLLGDAGLYVLYIWTGVVTANILIQFWVILGDVFTATQAKRIYGVLGLASMVGAIFGSAAVALAVRWIHPQTIVFGSAAGFVCASFLPRMFAGRRETARAAAREEKVRDPLLARFRANVKYATRGPYIWRLVGIALAGSTTVTLMDFVFKNAMAANVPPDELTSAFAKTYLVVNVLSLGAQLLAIGVLMRRLSPATMVAVLPVLLTIGGSALAATGGLFVAILAKGADGALRHGLYKTGLELLCVPLSEEGRRKVKAALEIVGQRGGQVLASSIILVVAALTQGPRMSALLLAGLALMWALLAFRFHGYYVEQFRESIEETPRRGGGHKLDVASLETLVATLDSESTDEVVAALRLLESAGKHHLVPGLILFHPNDDVVVASLRLFARKRRRLPAHAFDHVLKHPSTRVRAEAYAARVVLDPEAATDLRAALEDELAPEICAAIVTAMAATGALPVEEARERLAPLLVRADVTTKVIVAETIGWRRVHELDDVVIRLARDGDRQVQFAAVHALGSLGSRAAADALVGALEEEPLQERARVALVQCGREGFDALLAALLDPSRPDTLRWTIPRSLAAVDAPRAARALLENLEREADGMVRYRTLVALGIIVHRMPTLRLDRAAIDREIREHVARAYRYLDRRLILEAGATADPTRRTEGHGLLVDLLRDKEKSAVGRIFRLLALAFPQHDFEAIYRAIENGERPERAGAVELTSNLLPTPLREAVVGLVDDVDDEARLPFMGPFHERVVDEYEALIGVLLHSRSSIVRDVAAFHASEIGGEALAAQLADARAKGFESEDIGRAIDVVAGVRSKRSHSLDINIEATHVG